MEKSWFHWTFEINCQEVSHPLVFKKLNYIIPGWWSYKSIKTCSQMQMWLNRSMGIKTIIDGGIYEKPHLIYEHTTTKKLKLQTNSHNEISITLLNSFNGKRAVF